MRRLLAAVCGAGRGCWWWLRQVSGDAAYEDYLERRAIRRPNLAGPRADGPLLSRKEFYLDGLRRRYSGVSRCC